MADQLTSVRLSDDLLQNLRIIAEAHGTTVAAEIRSILEASIQTLQSSPERVKELASQLERQKAEREILINRLLAGAN